MDKVVLEYQGKKKVVHPYLKYRKSKYSHVAFAWKHSELTEQFESLFLILG